MIKWILIYLNCLDQLIFGDITNVGWDLGPPIRLYEVGGYYKNRRAEPSRFTPHFPLVSLLGKRRITLKLWPRI